MLSIYRRHRSKCEFANDRISKKCKCAIWATGTIEGKPYRKSLKTKNFERAEQLKRKIEAGKNGKAETTFHEASDLFVAVRSPDVQPPTIRKIKLLIRTLQEFADARGKKLLKDFDPAFIMAYRASWTEGPNTRQKKLERMRSMFRWFVETDLIPKTPIAREKSKPHDAAVEPFSKQEQEKILQAAYRLAGTRIKPKQAPLHPRTGTFAKLLLHSALRITDAATLTKDRIQGNRLFLYATKNKKPVTLPLPPDLVSELETIKSEQLFASPEGSQRPETVSDYWRDQLIKVFDAVGIKGHPHRFRHSVAVNMLDGGSSVGRRSLRDADGLASG